MKENNWIAILIYLKEGTKHNRKEKKGKENNKERKRKANKWNDIKREERIEKRKWKKRNWIDIYIYVKEGTKHKRRGKIIKKEKERKCN